MYSVTPGVSYRNIIIRDTVKGFSEITQTLAKTLLGNIRQEHQEHAASVTIDRLRAELVLRRQRS